MAFTVNSVSTDDKVVAGETSVAIECTDAGDTEGTVEFGGVAQTVTDWPAVASGNSTVIISPLDAGALPYGMHDMVVLRPDNQWGTDMVLVFRIEAGDLTLTIPAGNNGTYSGNIDWGDGDDTNAFSSYNDSALSHDYEQTTGAGDYIVRISGTFPWLFINNAGDKLKLISRLNMGDVGARSCAAAMKGTANLELLLTSISNLSSVLDFSNMMNNWPSLTATPDVALWDVSNGTNFSNMMVGWSSITIPPDVSLWNVSSGENFSSMMNNWLLCESPPDVSLWNVSSGKYFGSMMSGWRVMTTAPDVSLWNVSSGENFSNMMYDWEAMTTTPDVSLWNVSKGTNFSYMMYDWKAMTTPARCCAVGCL